MEPLRVITEVLLLSSLEVTQFGQHLTVIAKLAEPSKELLLQLSPRLQTIWVGALVIVPAARLLPQQTGKYPQSVVIADLAVGDRH